MPNKNLIQIISQEIFTASFISFVVFFILEIIKPGFVIYYFNFNIFLAIALVSGILAVWLSNDNMDSM